MTMQDLSAIEILRSEYNAQPENPGVARKLVQRYVDMGWYNEAIDLYRKLIGVHSNDYLLLLGYGNVLFRTEDYDKATEIFQKLTELKPNRIEGWNNLGIALLKSDALDEAGRAFQKVLELEPENVGAILNIGNYYSKSGDMIKARFCFEEAVSLHPDFSDAWYNLGNAALSLGDYQGAREAFEKALSNNRDFTSALKNLGFVCEKTDDLQMALTYYKRAALINKADPGLQVNLANIYLRVNKFEEARNSFLKAVKLAPKETSGWMGLRHVALLKGDITTYIRSTLAILSRLDAGVIASSIDVLRDLGHDGEAQELLSQVDRVNRDGDELDAQRLVMYQKKGINQQKIASIYKRLSALKEPSPLISRCLAEYAYIIGSYERVIKYIEPLENPSVSCLLMLWRSLVKIGCQQKAQIYAQEYSVLNPDCFECWMFLAEIRATESNSKEAKELLVKALRTGFTDLDSIKRNPFLSKIMTSLEKSGNPVK